MSEIEETLNRIQTHKAVQGLIIINQDATIIRTSYTEDKKPTGDAIVKSIHALTMKAKSTIRELDPQNELQFLRIKSKNHEIMVAPDKDYILIVVQGAKLEKKEEAE